MKNFGEKLENVSNEQLKAWINQHDPRFGAIESGELMRRSVKKVEETIKIFNDQSSRQTEKLIKLTWGIVGLTIVMVIGLALQIILALKTRI